MRALEFLRDVRAAWQRAAESGRPAGVALAPLQDAAARNLAGARFRRGVARVVRWFDGGPREVWTEARWPGARAGGAALLRVVLPERGIFAPGLEWAVRVASAIDELAGGPFPFRRPVRMHVSSLEADAGPLPRRAWTGSGRDAVLIEADFSAVRRGGATLWAEGVAGDVLSAAVGEAAGIERRFLPLTRVLLRVEGSEALEKTGVAVVSTLYWWATAGLDDGYRLFRWLEESVPEAARSSAAMHPARESGELTGPQIDAYAFEARLDGLWQLVAHFEPESAGEEEVAGWVREAEAAFRRGRPPASRPPGGSRRDKARIDRPGPGGFRADRAGTDRAGADYPRDDHSGLDGRDAGDSRVDRTAPARRRLSPPELPDPGLVWVPSAAHRPTSDSDRENRKRRRLRRRGVFLPAPEDIFDGERTLVEGILLLRARWGFDGRSAAKLAGRWIDKGAILPVRKRPGGGRTVLYFAFGSCMCAPSFRETVPRYDLLGPARLAGYRLAFTFESVGRNGGVADVVEDPRSDVWGVLYRIPRSFVPRLDAREGVHLGRYRQSWVKVEALGLEWPSVLTYTVANKAKTQVKPSDEYAGLIMEAAQTMLAPDYCRRLADLFARLGVEPSLPL